MFKRIMTVLISVLAMIFLGLLLMRLAGGWAPGLREVFPEAPRDPSSGPDSPVITVHEGTGVGEGKNRFIKRDIDGMPLHMLEVDMTPVAGTGRFDLKDPLMVFYSRNGQRLYVQSPKGYIDSKGRFPQSLDDISMGELSGGVRLWQDRGTKDAADDIVFTTDKMTYDQQRSRLTTEADVLVNSPEGVVRATGMVIELDTLSNEVRRVELVSRVRMELAGRDVGLGLFGDGNSTAAAGDDNAGDSGDAGGGGEASARVDAGGGAGNRASLYQFELLGNVNAAQGDRRLLAERLLLVSSMNDDNENSAGSAAAAGSVDASADELSRQAAAEAAKRRAAASPDEEIPDPILVSCDGPMFITPLGKTDQPHDALRVTATGRKVTLIDETMSAVCRTLTYDGATTVGLLDGKLEGRPDLPEMAVTVRQGESELVGPQITLDRTKQTLHVHGPGSLTGMRDDVDLSSAISGTTIGSRNGFGNGTGSSGSAGTAGDAGAGDDGAGRQADDEPLRAVWSRGMKAVFASRSVRQADGSTTDEPYLKEAAFYGRRDEPALVRRGDELMSGERIEAALTVDAAGKQTISRLQGGGNVLIKRPKSAEGDSFGEIAARDQLDMTFQQTPDGDSLPKRLLARGAVAVRSQDYDIEAGELTADFLPPLKPGGSVRLGGMLAAGDVKLRRDGLKATAAAIRTGNDTERVTLTGSRRKPAEVTMDDNRFLGETIEIYQKVKGQEQLLISGRGEMHILADLSQDANAGDDAGDGDDNRRVPISVQWQRKMSYDGHPDKNTAQFSGNVLATLPDTRLQTHDLWLFFSDKPPIVADADAAANGNGADAPADPAAALRQRKNFERMVAVGNVVALRTGVGSAGEAKEGRPPRKPNIQELTLRSGRLEHDARSGRSGVDGPGTITVHEYRPEAVNNADRVPVSKTDIAWQGKMVYDSQRLVLLFSKDVVSHVDGREMKIAGAAPMNVQNGSLRTQDLRIFLKPAKPDAAGAAGARGGALMGDAGFELKTLIASRQTTFATGEYVGSCDRLTYDAERDLMMLDGRPDALAEIWQRTPDGKRDNRQAGRRIMYWVQQQRAVVAAPEMDGSPSR